MSDASSMVAYTDTQRREAADWFVLIRAENEAQTESIQAWLRWMDENEGNRAAFDAVARAWHVVPTSQPFLLPTAEELLADEYDGDRSIEEWTRDHPPVTVAPTPPIFARVKSHTRHVWLAAASLIAAVSGVLVVDQYVDWRGARSDEFTTKIGEQMELTLSDGSHVWLGPKSKLVVAFDPERRGIQLTTGEAFFSVKKEPARPFTVRSSGGDIVAVGTAFNVRAVDEHVTVAVSEGIVAVTPKAQLDVRTPLSVQVASGQQITFTAQQPIKALAVVQTPTAGERAKWRDGVLVYRNESLQEVVNDIVRYSDRQIEIADESVRELRFSGVIYDDAVHEWVAALPESFPVTVVSDGTREIIQAR